MNRLRRVLGLCSVVFLAACAAPAAPLPSFRVSPLSLAAPVAVQQRLTVTTGGQQRQFQLALEADAQGLRVAVLDVGLIVARFEWDGQNIQGASAPGWPAALSADRLLAMLQLVHWPADALRPGLPHGWTLEADSAQRVLRHGSGERLVVRHLGAGRVEIDDRAGGYRVLVESREMEVAP